MCIIYATKNKHWLTLCKVKCGRRKKFNTNFSLFSCPNGHQSCLKKTNKRFIAILQVTPIKRKKKAIFFLFPKTFWVWWHGWVCKCCKIMKKTYLTPDNPHWGGFTILWVIITLMPKEEKNFFKKIWGVSKKRSWHQNVARWWKKTCQTTENPHWESFGILWVTIWSETWKEIG